MGRKPKLSLGPGQVLIKQRTQAAMKEKQERATASHNKPLESHIDVRDLDEVMEQAELAGRVFSALNPLPELLINPWESLNYPFPVVSRLHVFFVNKAVANFARVLVISRLKNT